MQAEGRICVRYFKRADGTVLTRDCPVGWKAVKRNVSKKATAFASLVFSALSGIGIASYFAETEIENQTMRQIESKVENPKMGEVADRGNEMIKSTLFKMRPSDNRRNCVMPQYTEGQISKLNKVKRQITKKQSH